MECSVFSLSIVFLHDIEEDKWIKLEKMQWKRDNDQHRN
jgi:hypothetical protein